MGEVGFLQRMDVSSTPRENRWLQRGSLAAIFVVATFLRLWPISSGLPYSDYVDEGYVLHQTVKVVQEKTYDTGMYQYPSLSCYLVAGAVVASSPMCRLVYGHSLEQDFPAPAEFHTPLGDAYDLIAPPVLIILGRAVVAAFSIGTVLLTGLLARLIIGRGESLIAMLLMALCPAVVSRASTVIVDSIATFFVIATLCVCARLPVGKDNAHLWRYALAAGCGAALAFVAKYPLGAVSSAVMITITTLEVTLITKMRLLLVSGTAFLVTSCVAMPPLLLKSAAVLAGLQSVANNYGGIKSDPGYWGAAVSSTELGLPLVFLGLAGIAVMFSDRRASRVAVLSWMTFAAVLLAGIVWAPFQPFRNLLSLVPLICIGAAVSSKRAHRWLANRLPRAAVTGMVALALMLLASSLAAETWRQIEWRRARVDTRVQAVDWLREHTRASDRILVVREVAILPTERKRVAANADIVPWFEALSALDREPFDYIVTGEPDLRLATDSAAWAAYRARWDSAISTLQLAAAFGHTPMFVVPYLWRTNDERILILRVR